MKYVLLLMLSVAFPSLLATPANASEWGCEVLLCASSSSPSWRGVDTCHPPMEKLISAMKKPGFSWPTCPEGGAGKPGYEKYAECPTGWTPTAADDARGQGVSREQSRCARRVTTCKGGYSYSGSSGGGRTETMADGVTRVFSGNNSCVYTEYKRRPPRSDPYYFDIKDEMTGQPSRFWFSLQR